MAKFYTRRDAEKILEAASFGDRGTWGRIAPEHDAYGTNLVVVNDAGVWPDEHVDQYAMRWKSCWEILDDPDAPDAGATPGLPFPFTAEQLAAFMLYGVGALAADAFGDWSQPPRMDELMHPDLNRAKDAVQGAFAAYSRAALVVGEAPIALEEPLRQAVDVYDAALRAAREKHGCTIRVGLDHDEYYRRHDLARGESDVRLLLSKLDELRSKSDAALATWRKAMVRELLRVDHAVSKVSNRKLSETQDREIGEKAKGGRSEASLARDYGVSRRLIHDALIRQNVKTSKKTKKTKKTKKPSASLDLAVRAIASKPA